MTGAAADALLTTYRDMRNAAAITSSDSNDSSSSSTEEGCVEVCLHGAIYSCHTAWARPTEKELEDIAEELNLNPISKLSMEVIVL